MMRITHLVSARWLKLMRRASLRQQSSSRRLWFCSSSCRMRSSYSLRASPPSESDFRVDSTFGCGFSCGLHRRVSPRMMRLYCSSISGCRLLRQLPALTCDCRGECSEGLQTEGTGIGRGKGRFLLEMGTLRTECISLNIIQIISHSFRHRCPFPSSPWQIIGVQLGVQLMRRFLTGCLVGGGLAYLGMSNFSKVVPSAGLPAQEQEIVSSYLHHHRLSQLLKQSIMNGYMQLNKAFLDYGLRERMEGFFFYGTYFRQAEIDANGISHAYCIFSPKEQLCGHPNIQHGGATATIVDQNSGLLAMIFSYELVATSALNVRYLKTIKKGQTYAWHGEVERREGRKIFVKSNIVELETGVVCVQADTLMMTVNWEHKMGEVFHLLFKREDKLEEVN